MQAAFLASTNILDVVREHKSTESDHIDATADVNVLGVNENGKATQDVVNRICGLIYGVENEKVCEIKNVVVTFITVQRLFGHISPRSRATSMQPRHERFSGLKRTVMRPKTS